MKEVPGFKGYWCSEDGRITGKNGRLLKPGSDRRGYLKVWAYRDGVRYELYIHRAVAMTYVPGDYSLTVNHIDGNKHNNHFSNLEWLTNGDNLRHSFKIGLRDTKKTWETRRARYGGHEYTPVSEINNNKIKECFDRGMKKTAIAKLFNIHRATVTKILETKELNI